MGTVSNLAWLNQRIAKRCYSFAGGSEPVVRALQHEIGLTESVQTLGERARIHAEVLAQCAETTGASLDTNEERDAPLPVDLESEAHSSRQTPACSWHPCENAVDSWESL